jgi:hypothetical protein
MVGIRTDAASSVSLVRTHSAEVSGASDSPTATDVTGRDHLDGFATFNFDGKAGGVAYPSLSPAQQDGFKADFARELAGLNAWSTWERWLPFLPAANLQIFVSDEYKISKSLLPAAIGQKGRMEFPAWKVVAGEAAIMHELVHAYFPNGNRLLAEGLAVYLQAAIGGNPAFPNFGQPLHEMARDLLRKMVPEFACGLPQTLEKIRIVDLDKIATPSPLRLRVGLNLYEVDAFGQAHIYPIAGSFVQFLVEAYGMEKFRSLFLRTPLQPFERNPGSSNRWSEVYGVALNDIAEQWKSKMAERAPHS